MGLVFLVPADGPIRSVADLIAAARSRPDAINLGTVGVGSTQHFVAEAFQALTGVRFTHVPYRGTPDLIVALRQGQLHVVVETVAAVLGPIRAGEVRALALSTASRFSGLADVPTMQEAGVAGFDLATWFTIAFPAGVPAAAIARVNAATRAALDRPELRARLLELGLTPVGSSAEDAAAVIRRDIARWRDLVASAGIPQQD
jgi:tripartite-type tricarboxylate transporter receptor subunit TctC